MLVEVDAPLEIMDGATRRPLTAEDIKGDPGDPGPTTPATTGALGAVKVSTAPADADNPVALGVNDDAVTNARTPTAHTHPQSDVTGLVAALGAKQDASTAATDTELAAETATRAAADTTITAAAAAAQATADAALPKAGGTMTGDVVLVGDPTANLHPATRQYVLAQIAALINGAPGALDTLKELADQLAADESAVSALTSTVAGKLAAASNLSDLTNAGTARTNLGLGTAATQASGAFDSAGAAAAAQAASQPLDSDLTAIAALTTTSFGRAFLELANAAAGRTALGLGTAAVAATGDFDASGAAAAAQAASQPLDSDLTAIAALTTTSFGRAFLALADAAAARTAIGTDASSATRTPTDASVTDAKIATTLSQSKITNLTTDLAAKQPLDADLTAVAALTTTSFGRALLELANAAAGRTALGLGTAATAASGDFGVLGKKSWAQVSDYTITATATAPLTDVDATNLAVTFNAPASGDVIVILNAAMTAPAAAAMFWGLKESTSNVGSIEYAGFFNSASPIIRITCTFLVTGLTPGSSHTYKWGAAVTSGSGKIVVSSGAGGGGPATMIVMAA